MNTGDHGGVNPEDVLAEAIVDDAVRRRRAEGWARRRVLDDATVAATLRSNVGEGVDLILTTGERLHGTVVAAGPGVVLDASIAHHLNSLERARLGRHTAPTARRRHTDDHGISGGRATAQSSPLWWRPLSEATER